MSWSRGLSLVFALLAWWLYRNEHVLRNNILFPPVLPAEYAAGKSQCVGVRAPGGSFQPVKFCEHGVFWDHLDAEGKVQDRHVIASCDPGRRAWNTVMGPLRDPKPRGALWLYSTSTGKVEQFTLDGFPRGHDFHPLGFDIRPSHAGNASRLYVVNHARAHTVIEQFLVSPASPTRATWVRTLAHPSFVSPNALALTSDTSFYLSNDHRFTRRLPAPLGPLLATLESVLALPLGWVAHVSLDESDALTVTTTVAAPRIPFANGVALSPAGDTLAVASTSTGSVRFYARDRATNALAFRAAVKLPFLPDNVRYDDAGALVVAGHTSFPGVEAVAKDAARAKGAGSWAVAIRETRADAGAAVPEKFDMAAPVPASRLIRGTPGFAIETVYQSDGSKLPTACTALRDSRKDVDYVFGLYADTGFVVCRP